VQRTARPTGDHGTGASEEAPLPAPPGQAAPAAAQCEGTGEGGGALVPWQALDGLGLALRLPHDARSATALRHSVGGLAFALGLGRAIVADVRQALTEISGALLHSAAGAADGHLEVDVRVRGSRLEVRLLDRGAPMPAVPEHPLSLALVAALSDTVRVRRPPEGGVEVLVSFDLRSRRPPAGDAPQA